MDYLKEAKTIEKEIIEWRRHLHRYPEVSGKEEKTCRYVAEALRKMGLDVREKVGGFGVLADIKAPSAAKTIAFRADIDALPLQEESDPPYKSQHQGLMHACGHDGHTAMLLGAAKLIMSCKDSLKAGVRLIFQPSEEVPPGGALAMIKEGALEGVHEIFGFHIHPIIPASIIGSCAGPMMASMDEFKIAITGKGGHGSAPDLAVDPITPAAQIVLGLQTIISGSVPPLEKAVVSLGRIHAGNRTNIIPRTCEIGGAARTLSPRMRDLIERRIKEISHGICSAHGASCRIEYERSYPVLANTEAALDEVKSVLENLGIPFMETPPHMTSEDFAYYLEKIPGCFMFIGGRNDSKGLTEMIHTPGFDFDEDLLHKGAAVYLALALRQP